MKQGDDEEAEEEEQEQEQRKRKRKRKETTKTSCICLLVCAWREPSGLHSSLAGWSDDDDGDHNTIVVSNNFANFVCLFNNCFQSSTTNTKKVYS
jgi:hypothetical protein